MSHSPDDIQPMILESTPVSFARRLRRESLIVFGFLVLTAVMTWPWVLHLRTAVGDEGDSYAHAYFLWWDYHQTFHDPLHLFDATIFYPYRNTLAFGENDYGIALLFFPLFAFGLRPLTMYSVAAFLSFPFTGYGMFRLARTLSASNSVAWVAAIALIFIPYRFHHLAHLPLIFAGWIPLLFEALILFARERSWRRAGWLGVTFFMNALTCFTWFILVLIPLAVSGVLLLARYRAWRDSSFWLRVAISLCLSSLFLIPFLLPFRRAAQSHGFVRGAAEVQVFSASAANWLAVQEGNRFWKGLGAGRLDYEMALFPGVVILLLALISIVGSVWLLTRHRSRRISNSAARATTTPNTELLVHGSVWIVIGFCGSLGLNFFVHRLLYEFVPLFRAMRAAVRWSMICYLGLALLAGLGARCLVQALQHYWPRLPAAPIYALLILFVLLDQRVAPLPLVRGQVDPDEMTVYLKEKKMSGGIVELPAGDSSTLYMLRAADHQHPLVTARNSFTPPIDQEIEALTTNPPIPERLLDLLETIPASYVTIHNAFMSPERRMETEDFLNRGINAGRLRFIRSFDGGMRSGLRLRNDLYAVVKTEPEALTEGPRPPPVSRAAREPLFTGLVADFQQTGFFLYRLYEASYGRAPLFAEFLPDVQLLKQDGSDENLEAGKQKFIGTWIERPEFKAKYQSLNDEHYVDTLLADAGLTTRGADRDKLILDLRNGATTRAAILRNVIENNSFEVREFNRAFVLLHYFGYLKRDPDEGGYQFWLYKLDRHNDYAGFTEAFAASTERQLKIEQK